MRISDVILIGILLLARTLNCACIVKKVGYGTLSTTTTTNYDNYDAIMAGYKSGM